MGTSLYFIYQLLSALPKKLSLLREHYVSDRKRLESSLEAGAVFEQLPSGECPVCGHIPILNEATLDTDMQLAEFQIGCSAEIDKIGLLLRDLDQSEISLQSESKMLIERERELSQIISQSNMSIKQLLERKTKSTK